VSLQSNLIRGAGCTQVSSRQGDFTNCALDYLTLFSANLFSLTFYGVVSCKTILLLSDWISLFDPHALDETIIELSLCVSTCNWLNLIFYNSLVIFFLFVYWFVRLIARGSLTKGAPKMDEEIKNKNKSCSSKLHIYIIYNIFIFYWHCSRLFRADIDLCTHL